jgi:hypothetical protein
MIFDSTLSIPTTCGVPTLKSNITKKAAIAFDSCNNKIYKYNPKTLTWSEISGGSSTIPNLQQVTDSGATTTNNIIIKNNGVEVKDTIKRTVIAIGSNYVIQDKDYYPAIHFLDSTNNNYFDLWSQDGDFNLWTTANCEFGDVNAQSYRSSNNGIGNYIQGGLNRYTKNWGGNNTDIDTIDIIPITKNVAEKNTYYYPATTSASKTDTLATLRDVRTGSGTSIDTANKWVNSIYRKAGIDSIFYKIGSTEYKIKDSTATAQTFAPTTVPYANGSSVLTSDSSALRYYSKTFAIGSKGAIGEEYALDLDNGRATIYGNFNGMRLNVGSGTTGVADSSKGFQFWNKGVKYAYFGTGVDGNYFKFDSTNIFLPKLAGTSDSMAVISATTGKIKAAAIPSASGYVPYTGATQNVDLGSFHLNAQAVKINGTAGNGHIDLKHQSADASATGSSSVLFANSDGDIKWKNDSKHYTTFKTSLNTADRIYTFSNKDYIIADSADVAARVKYSDTATMLSPYLRKVDTASLSSRINLKVNISDTSTMLTKYLRKSDTATLSDRINLKVNISDTSTMLNKYLRKTDTATLSTRIDAKGYALNLGGTNATINASSTYYLGIPGLTITNTAAIRRVYIPQSGTIKSAQFYVKTTNTTTTENWTISIRLNNSSNTTLATVGNTTTDKVFATSGLSIAVVAGDYIELTTTTPAFVTAPGSTYIYGSIFIQ